MKINTVSSLRGFSRHRRLKIILMCFIAWSSSLSGFGQLSKKDWMMGGSAGFYWATSDGSNAMNYRISELDILPNGAYFFAERFAAGIRGRISFSKTTDLYPRPDGTIGKSRDSRIGIGPFARYYFLPADKIINVFGEAAIVFNQAYSRSDGTTSYNSHEWDYSFATGVVVFLNSSVGIESIVSYQQTKTSEPSSVTATTIGFGVGLQIHFSNDNH